MAPLRELFSDLAADGFTTFAQTPDGGATMSDLSGEKVLRIGPAGRSISLHVTDDLDASASEASSLIMRVGARLPVQPYIIFQSSVTSHVHVDGETPRELLDRKLFAGGGAFDALGPGRIGTGIRVILTATGQESLSVEPLLAEPEKTLFVQHLVVRSNTYDIGEVDRLLNDVVRYNKTQVKNWLTQALGD